MLVIEVTAPEEMSPWCGRSVMAWIIIAEKPLDCQQQLYERKEKHLSPSPSYFLLHLF